MTENNTKDLTDAEKLDLILSKLGNVETRLGALETRAEDREGSTRPLLDRIIQEMIQTRDTLNARLDGVEKELSAINHRLDVFAVDISKIRGDVRGLDGRLTEVERRPN